MPRIKSAGEQVAPAELLPGIVCCPDANIFGLIKFMTKSIHYFGLKYRSSSNVFGISARRVLKGRFFFNGNLLSENEI